MNWDDLRFFLALARAGTYSAAGAELGVNHTTVARRLQSLQEHLDVLLFDRTPEGFTLTAAGEEMLETAERVEGEMHQLDRTLTGRNAQLRGALHVTTIESIITCFPEDFSAFARTYPEVELDISVDYTKRDLSRREADIAIRATNQPDEHLVGRRIATLEYALYGQRDLLERHDHTRDLNRYPWIGWTLRYNPRVTNAWIHKHAPNARTVLRADSLLAIHAFLLNGLGIAHLPCFLGDSTPALQRLTDVLPGFAWDVWALTHPDLRNTARIRAFMEHIAEAFARRADIFEGRSRVSQL